MCAPNRQSCLFKCFWKNKIEDNSQSDAPNIWNMQLTGIEGGFCSLGDYKQQNKLLLVVNVATKCGFAK